MALIKPKNPKIKGLNEVGRYAVGVQWADGHDSIYPLESLRRRCPCRSCEADGDGKASAADSPRLKKLARMGEQAVFLQWGDGHETLYSTRDLRELCRCAHCSAEPERPITGG
jgi:DUF971 family protein